MRALLASLIIAGGLGASLHQPVEQRCVGRFQMLQKKIVKAHQAFAPVEILKG
mgnify:CR=1 FL=1